MKKVLLLSLSVCAVLSASAIDRTVKMAQKANVSLQQSYSPLKSYATIAKESLNIGSSKVKAKLPAIDDIYGLYVSESTDEGDGTIAFAVSSNIELIKINETDPETGDIYNVEIDGLFGNSDVIGYYDSEAGTITIPAQYCYEHPSYGLLAFYGVTSFDEEQGYGLEDQLVLQVQEDENGFYFEPAEGYIGYCSIFTEGQYANYIMEVCYNDVIINPANYIVTGESRNALTNDSEWEDLDDYGVFLEMINDETMFIHGFMGMGNVEVKFDETGLATIPTYQPVRFANVDGAYQYVGAPVAWDVDGNSISINNDRECVYAGWYTFTFNATGEQVTGFALYDGREEVGTGWEYYSLGVEGMRGGFGPLCVLTLITENQNAAGIHELSNPVLKKPATFNLSGKRVGKNAKGLLIENGKKVLR